MIYFLSGLTCTDENASQKGGMQRYADEHGIALVFPDTSPRGLKVEGESDSWDFGVGAGKILFSLCLSVSLSSDGRKHKLTHTYTYTYVHTRRF